MQGRRFRFDVNKNIETNYLKEMLLRIYQAVLRPEDIFNIFNDLAIKLNAQLTSIKVVDIFVTDLVESPLLAAKPQLKTSELQGLLTPNNKEIWFKSFDCFSTAIASSDFILTSNESGCEIFAEFVRDDGITLRVDFRRQTKKSAFSESDLEFLNLLYPHFIQFIRLSKQFQAKQFDLESDSTSLKYLSRPLWIVNEDLQLIFNNQISHQLTPLNECIYWEDGLLYTKDKLQHELLKEKVRKVSRQSSYPNMLSLEKNIQSSEKISLGSDFHTENFWIMPIEPSGNCGGSVVIMGRKKTPKKEWIENNFGLTPRQTDLCLLLMQGCSLMVAAQHLHISVNTVRNLLAACFRVLEVNNQSELIRILYGEILVDKV